MWVLLDDLYFVIVKTHKLTFQSDEDNLVRLGLLAIPFGQVLRCDLCSL